MSSIDEIKQKKLEEMQKKHADQAQEQKQLSEEEIKRLQQEIDAIEEFVKRKFTKEAYERYGNLKSAHPQKALQLITWLAQIISSGSLQVQITDDQLKMLLSKMITRKEFTITRR